MRHVLIALLLSGCVPGCGGDPTPPPSSSGAPVRLEPGLGGEDEAASTSGGGGGEDLADPPPVEPPPP